jgi:hypothetical protein
VDGILQSAVARLILDVDIQLSTIQQKVTHSRGRVLERPHQWSFALVKGIDVGAVLEQGLRKTKTVVFDGQVQQIAVLKSDVVFPDAGCSLKSKSLHDPARANNALPSKCDTIHSKSSLGSSLMFGCDVLAHR